MEIKSFRDIVALHAGRDVVFVRGGRVWLRATGIEGLYVMVTIDDEQWVWWTPEGSVMDNRAQFGTPDFDRFEAWCGEVPIHLDTRSRVGGSSC